MEKVQQTPMTFTGVVAFPSFLTEEQGREFMCKLHKIGNEGLAKFNYPQCDIKQDGEKIRMTFELNSEEGLNRKGFAPEEMVFTCWMEAIHGILSRNVDLQKFMCFYPQE